MATSWPDRGPTAPSQNPSDTDRRKKPQQRQLLSCTKCRERKVKCDRTKPCLACCARGHPRECEFIVGEGNDYSPIQQSYEIRKLRQENLKLKERLREARHCHSDEGDAGQSSDKESTRATAARQRRFRTGDRIDNLYFGTPGLANIISDFGSLQIATLGHNSLTHPLPRGQDIYRPPENGECGSSYPFATLWVQKTDTSVELLKVLPERNDLLTCLDMFQHRAQSCSFPHVPDDTTKREIMRFLEDARGNAERHPDMLALLFATLATGMQMGVYDRSGQQWVAGATEQAIARADVYLAASMQALRMASFMNQPTLLGIQALVLLGPYLTNSGRFLDAWTLFGTTIRMAHSIGLHRNPRLLDPTPETSREVSIRQSLWWWMLHMDQQYSVTLGRPLGISGFGDCPPPEHLTTNQTVLRLGEFVDHFTILGRQILSSDSMTSVARIDEFTDRLMALWDTMPEALQFNESWLQQETSLPDWPLDVMSATLFANVQSYVILLNRQRDERTQGIATSAEGSPPHNTTINPSSRTYSSSSNSVGRYTSPESHFHPAPIRGRALVINSSVLLLQTFLYFYHRRPAVMICWSVGQQAFNACMILILDALETGNTSNDFFVNQAFAVFTELDQKRIHKLAGFAVQRISDGLAKLEEKKRERSSASVSMSSRRRFSDQPYQITSDVDSTAMIGFPNDSVMGNTGMFLLEDPGLQSLTTQQTFQPLTWTMAGSSSDLFSSSSGYSPTIPSPIIPVSQVTATPFPVMAPPYVPSVIPVTDSPYAVGLQLRMPAGIQTRPMSSRTYPGAARATANQAAFTPINTAFEQHSMAQQQFLSPQGQQYGQPSQANRTLRSTFHGRGAYHGHIHGLGQGQGGHAAAASAGPRGVHRVDRSHRTQQRRHGS